MSNEKIRQDVLTYMESHATHPVSYDDLGWEPCGRKLN